MNRTIKTSRIKLTIFFVTSLFAVTFLFQSTAYGQIVKPDSPLIITGKPTIRPDISNRLLPDLQIADITYNPTKCLVKIRVVNTGGPTDASMQYGSGLGLWVNIVGTDPKMWPYKMWPYLRNIYNLAANQEFVHEIYFGAGGYKGGGAGYDFSAKDVCKINDLKEVHAVVDPRYLQAWEPEVKRTIYGDLINPGTAVPAGWTVVEPLIKEKNENNNELIVKKADMKLY